MIKGHESPKISLIHLSQAARYSVLALVYLSKREALCFATDISKEMRLSPTFLAKVLQRLAHARLVIGKRGLHGGYRLALAAEKIILADVVSAVDTAMKGERQCVLEMRACSAGRPCVMHHRLKKAEVGLWCALRTTRLSDIAADMLRPS